VPVLGAVEKGFAVVSIGQAPCSNEARSALTFKWHCGARPLPLPVDNLATIKWPSGLTVREFPFDQAHLPRMGFHRVAACLPPPYDGAVGGSAGGTPR
jgi:hypothetical protein